MNHIEIIQKINRKLIPEGPLGCFVWTGAQTGSGISKYGRLKLQLPGDPRSKSYYVHRMTFIAYNQLGNIPANLDISHICHNSLCANIGHLSLEPHSINNNRQVCRSLGRCTTHTLNGILFASCIF
ncbi:MAG: HNH endonuclease [gamma proteobacterium symbiont of Lucinoma myriamae]|nr:HNH endonuclease [gamma proteobacterium symbiont of Lucinoma myriamae]MCU7799277.1 HNH endonuclease [gamma proteobacterium symbiont of Lucinoma myriamae]MCU7799279.1 HNH endonuclease [gamma proteobacterium symbiont of Lucinoma myriamae]